MEYKIRRAADEDIPAVLGLLLQVDMVHHRGRPDIFKGPATKYNAEELKELFRNDASPVFVCVDPAGDVIGHAFCVHKQIVGDHVLTDVRTLYIDDICVDEAHRGQGVGKALYRYVIGYAKEHGFYNVTLNVWSCNPQAQRFYEAMGMQPQKTGMELLLDK